jgi:NADH dehydrogenase
MTFQRILVIGGTGFIGRAIVARLAARGLRVTVPTRRLARARPLMPLPTVNIVETDIHDAHALASLARGHDAVINLVGILHGRGGSPYGAEFARAHVELPRSLVAACAAAGITRLLHMSALGADGPQPLPSMYLRSKADGEQAVMNAPLDWTIFRPSVVFGPDDRFLNLFATLQRFAPVMPLARADTRFQPIHVEDVAQAFVNALERRDTFRRGYELAGPRVYTLRELVRLAGRRVGCQRPVINLPDMAGRLQAMILEALPGPTLMSLDNFDSMARDSVARAPMAPELGIDPVAIEDAAGDPVATRQARLDQSRGRAGR